MVSSISGCSQVLPITPISLGKQATLRKFLDATGKSLGLPIPEFPVASGSFGSVYITRSRAHQPRWAVKLFKVEEGGNSDEPDREALIYQMVAGLPNITQLHQVYTASNLKSRILVYPYAGADLVDHMNHLRNKCQVPSVVEAVSLMQGIGNALVGLHQRGLCHNDLRPENVCLDPSRRKVTIVDVGMVKKMDEHGKVYDTYTETCETPPEVFYLGQGGSRSDVCGWGTTMLVYLTGRSFFSMNLKGYSEKQPFLDYTIALLTTMELDKLPDKYLAKLNQLQRQKVVQIDRKKYQRRCRPLAERFSVWSQSFKDRREQLAARVLTTIIVAMCAFEPEKRPTAEYVLVALQGGGPKALGAPDQEEEKEEVQF